MSAKRLTRPMVNRTIHLVENSGVLDILAPPTPSGQRGRKGQIRANTRLWAIGVILCTRLGHETTVAGVHGVLTEALPRDLQWQLGVLRPLTTKAAKPRGFDPEQARLTKNGKPRKEIWVDEGYERIGYDDLVNVANRIKDRLDYGYGTAPDLTDEERDWRRTQVEDAVDRLITISVIPRSCTTCAIDGTGQWSWNIGPAGSVQTPRSVWTPALPTLPARMCRPRSRSPPSPPRRSPHPRGRSPLCCAAVSTPPGATRPASRDRRRSATGSTSTRSSARLTRTRSDAPSRSWSKA